MAGLFAPDAGLITVGGRTLFNSAAAENIPPGLRQVGYVFQGLALFPHMTIAANLEYGLAHLSPADRMARTRAAADSFRISHVLSRLPSAISGGERQRAALACSLVTDPAVLLLDEPLTALDHATASRIIDDLRGWNAAHRIPILYVTHAHREVFALGERVVVLDGGRIVASGTPHEVLESPSSEPLAQLAGFENVFSATIVERKPDAGTMQYRLAIRAGDILLAVEEPRGLSARNILRGRVVSLTREGPTIHAAVDAGGRFTVDLTPGARDALKLAAGDFVWLIIKTHSFRIVSV